MRYSDNQNGTFTNPLIYGDYPDPDIIRVGGDFYLVSSSFTQVPGIPICHSRDLLNWEIIGHAYARLPEINPAYSMQDGKVAYRGGSWAPFIRHRDGKFYIGFCTPAEGFFMAIADHAAGPYELISFGLELYDPSLLFANDGRVFIAHGANGIFITELTADARGVKGEPRFIFQTPVGNPLEGSHLYQRQGWFYLCLTSRAYNGIQVVLRARDIYGPYEWRIISADDLNYSGAGLHQGGFVSLENDETWFFLFQDRDWVGRVPILQPVRWIDDWPVLGDPNNFGKASVTCRKPALPPQPLALPERSDHFEASSLGLWWQWNHNPDDARWSLTERPGWLRLRGTFATDLLAARNTLSQKIIGPASTATTKLDMTGLQPCDVAGVSVLNIPYALLGVSVSGTEMTLVMQDNGQVLETQVLPREPFIYLRAAAKEDGMADFSYSLDGSHFVKLGKPFLMQFTVKTFLGNRFGVFCYRTSKEGKAGFADFDFLEIDQTQTDNQFSAFSRISAVAYDAEYGTDTQRILEKQPGQYLCDLNHGDWVRFDRVDFGTGATQFCVRAAPIGFGGQLEIRRDQLDGPLLGTCVIPGDGLSQTWNSVFSEYHCPILPTTGIQKIYLRSLGTGRFLFRLDWLTFLRK